MTNWVENTVEKMIDGNPFKIVGFGILGLVLVAVSVGGVVHHTTQETVTATVTGKERITESNGEGVRSYYLVFTDYETFRNSDSIWGRKFNSSDLYGSLREGMTCEFTVTGFRIGWASMYRNIIRSECE